MSLNLRQPGLGELDEEWKAFEKQGPVPSLTGDYTQIRAAMKLIPLPPLPQGLSVRDKMVPGFEGYQNSARIYTPKPSQRKAIVIYIHGGGWTLGDLDTEDAVCRTICIENQVIVVSIDYRKAPENPFPTGLEDAWAAVLWTFENATFLGGSPDNVVIAGLSAGANFAAVLAQRAVRTKEVSFTGQVLRFPIVVHPDAQPKDLDFSSYEENATAPMMSTPTSRVYLSHYKPPKDDLRMSPLLANDVTCLPRTFIQIAGADPLRDDSFAYAEKLHEAGVPVRTKVYAGMPHAFTLMPLNASKSSDQDLVRGIKWLIGDN